jgi:hypothetical protein
MNNDPYVGRLTYLQQFLQKKEDLKYMYPPIAEPSQIAVIMREKSFKNKKDPQVG